MHLGALIPLPTVYKRTRTVHDQVAVEAAGQQECRCAVGRLRAPTEVRSFERLERLLRGHLEIWLLRRFRWRRASPLRCRLCNTHVS